MNDKTINDIKFDKPDNKGHVGVSYTGSNVGYFVRTLTESSDIIFFSAPGFPECADEQYPFKSRADLIDWILKGNLK